MFFGKTRALLARRRPGGRGSPGSEWRIPARFVATAAATAALLAAGAHGASAATAHFVPEATKVGWDGVVATVSFREVDVAVGGRTTTISVKVTGDVTVFCTNGESTLDIHASATASAAKDYPVKDGVVAGIAKFPIEAKVTPDPGYTCVLRHRSITAVLEDFRTGATLVHHQA